MPLLLGAIVIWSGSIASIPAGWQLCNGTNGTPDLRNRFILGAGDVYAVNATGGQTDGIIVSHNHGGSLNTAGSHTHTGGGSTGGSGTGGWARYQISGTFSSSYNGDHSHTGTTQTTGSSLTNTNLPPYFALAYIQQIS
jgi:hypothetical protein